MSDARYHRGYYARNAETIKANRRKRDKELARQQREYVAAYKEAEGCKVCGIKEAVVLDLDHRDPAQKRGNVSTMCGKVSWDSLYAEIAKCDVLCANCHRRKTHCR